MFESADRDGPISTAALVEAIAESTRRQAVEAGRQARLIAELDRRYREAMPDRPQAVLDELSVALRCSRGSAHHRLELALTLQDRLPQTGQALADGEIGLGHVFVLVERLAGLPADTCRRIEGALVEEARREIPAVLSRTARRTAAANRPPEAPELQTSLLTEDRQVRFNPLRNTMWAQLSAEAFATVRRALHERADRTGPDDDRLIEARLHDALEEICLTSVDPKPAAVSRGARAGLHVVVTAETLAGHGRLPAELIGVGPIATATLHRFACDAWLTPLLVDNDGRLLSLGRTRRFPDARLLRHLIARDQTCQFPGCPRPAHRCEAHHAVPWYRGGPTDPVNCLMLCSRHHHAVHEGGWKIVRHRDETTTWISPLDRRLRVSPPRYPVLPRAG